MRIALNSKANELMVLKYIKQITISRSSEFKLTKLKYNQISKRQILHEKITI